MASAIFIVPMTDSGPTLDMELISDDGSGGYGFSVIGQVPQASTCLVRIWSSDAVLDALATDEHIEFVEDVADGEGN